MHRVSQLLPDQWQVIVCPTIEADPFNKEVKYLPTKLSGGYPEVVIVDGITESVRIAHDARKKIKALLDDMNADSGATTGYVT